MLSKEILEKINNKEITSRRQLYKLVGRTKKLLQWLNDNNILIPNKWTKEMFVYEMKKTGLNTAGKNWNMTRLAKRFYGSWNNALTEVFGTVNQYRYEELSNEQLIDTIKKFIKKYQRLPLREEFDGSSLEKPYFEVFFNRFNIKKWNEVFSLFTLTKIYSNKKYGTGKVIIYKDIIYLSHKEYLIGKYLNEKNIKFEKEVPYENCNFVFDFYLPEHNVFIEYYGMETDDYKKRIEEKRKFYNGRKVIEIFKHDNTLNKLSLEVQRL